MSTHSRMRSMIKRRLSLNGLGSPISIISYGKSVFDPDTQEMVRQETEVKTSGVCISVKSFHINNTTVLAGDVDFEISCEAFKTVEITDIDGNVKEETVYYETPQIKPSDIITYNDKSYSVLNIKTRHHGGILLGYKVRGRIM